MQRSLYEIIDAAQELLENGWVSGHFALDETGRDVSPTDEKATRYCQIGALMAVAHYEAHDEHKLVQFCNSVINMANSGMTRYNQIPNRNDTNSKEDAIGVFERTKAYIAKKFGTKYVPNWLMEDRNVVSSKQG